MKCCFGEYLRLAARYGDTPQPGAPSAVQVQNYLGNMCGLPVPGQCARPLTALRVLLRLANIAAAWSIQPANRLLLILWLRADIAAAVGTPPNDVTDAGVGQVGTVQGFPDVSSAHIMAATAGLGTDVILNVNFETTTVLSTAQTSLSGQISSGTLDLTNTNSNAPTSARIDPTQGVSLDSSASTTTTVNNAGSDASHVAPAMVTALGVAIVSLILAN